MYCLKKSLKLIKCEGKLLGSSSPRIENYTSALSLDLNLLCVHPEASESLLDELHEGVCGSYTRGRSLSHKALTQGYWWPNMQKETQEYVKKCDRCQRFAPNIHQLGGVLNPLSSP